MLKKSSLSPFFDRIAGRYAVFNFIASLGMVEKWRRALAGSLEGKSGLLLDLCTGTGEVIREVHRIAPQVEAVGIDASLEMVRRFKDGNSHALLSCAERLPFKEGVFNAAAVAFGLRNLSDLDGALYEVARVLKENGEFVILEFSQPNCAVTRFLHRIFLRLYIPIAGFITTGAIRPFIYLSASILGFDGIDKLKRRFSECGFEVEDIQNLSFGAVGLYKLKKR